MVTEFRKEQCALFSLTKKALLYTNLEAGLSALNTTQCESDKNLNCPVCNADFGQLATKLPFAHYLNSCLVCRITGKIMDADNPPLVLPNGYVYSSNTVSAMVRDTGLIRCTRTGQMYTAKETRKAFIS